MEQKGNTRTKHARAQHTFAAHPHVQCALYSALCTEYAECFSLAKEDLVFVMEMYPDVQARLEKKSNEINRLANKARNKVYMQDAILNKLPEVHQDHVTPEKQERETTSALGTTSAATLGSLSPVEAEIKAPEINGLAFGGSPGIDDAISAPLVEGSGGAEGFEVFF